MYFNIIFLLEICNPNFTIPSLRLRTIAVDGMCSYGAGNTGSYTSTFFKKDIYDQAYNNPADRFDYTELLKQAKMQTYVLTDLFGTTCVPKSVFSEFLPGETLPTTDFLFVSPPSDPNPLTEPATTC